MFRLLVDQSSCCQADFRRQRTRRSGCPEGQGPSGGGLGVSCDVSVGW